MAEVICPVCSEVGRSGTLVLRQINAEEAIYVCTDSQCPYPVGLSDQIVQNPVPELQPNADQPEENGVAELEEEEATNTDLERPAIDEYEVNILLDPELDAMMEEL